MKARILAVDDTAAMLDNLAQILTDAGYETLTADCATAALQAASAGFDVAIVDLRLPDGGGLALAARLKERAPDCEAILLTGYATLESASAAVRIGAFAYLMKPCPTEELLETIDQAVQSVRTRAENSERLRRAQIAEKIAAVGQMTAGLSHEIRNPLNAASLQLLLLDRAIGRLPAHEQPGLQESLHLARDEIRRLGNVFDDFLHFARPRALNLAAADLARIGERVLHFVADDAARRDVKLESELSSAPLRCDEEALRQAMLNLALNAIEATPPGGCVRLCVRPEGANVFAAVEDSGDGIAPDVRPRIFEPFFTTKANGTGLGLPIVHAIVTQHGGTVGVDTSKLGGARFWLRVPVQ
jgi:signal transduction histidine kinase